MSLQTNFDESSPSRALGSPGDAGVWCCGSGTELDLTVAEPVNGSLTAPVAKSKLVPRNNPGKKSLCPPTKSKVVPTGTRNPRNGISWSTSPIRGVLERVEEKQSGSHIT